MRLRTSPRVRFSAVTVVSALALLGLPQAAAAGRVSVPRPVSVTRDLFAGSEESLGMDGTGTRLAGAWNDFDFNDGCGFAFSSDGGTTWAPRTFVPGFTQFTNDPNVPGTGSFGVAGDPSVAWNPAFRTFDVACQAFNTSPPFPIQLLATTFDPAKANPNANENQSYGPAAWTHPVAVGTGTKIIGDVDRPGHRDRPGGRRLRQAEQGQSRHHRHNRNLHPGRRPAPHWVLRKWSDGGRSLC